MQLNLAYGQSGLTVNLPDATDVVEARFVPGLPDEAAAIRAALRNRLAPNRCGSGSSRGIKWSLPTATSPAPPQRARVAPSSWPNWPKPGLPGRTSPCSMPGRTASKPRPSCG